MPILRNISLSWSWVDFDIRLCLPVPSRYSGLLSTAVFTEESTTLMCWNPKTWQLEYLDISIKHQMNLFMTNRINLVLNKKKSLTNYIATSSTLKKILANYWTIIFLSWLSCELTVVAKLLGVCKYKWDSPITFAQTMFPNPLDFKPHQ